jgi:hypothetical protein
LNVGNQRVGAAEEPWRRREADQAQRRRRSQTQERALAGTEDRPAGARRAAVQNRAQRAVRQHEQGQEVAFRQGCAQKARDEEIGRENPEPGEPRAAARAEEDRLQEADSPVQERAAGDHRHAAQAVLPGQPRQVKHDGHSRHQRQPHEQHAAQRRREFAVDDLPRRERRGAEHLHRARGPFVADRGHGIEERQHREGHEFQPHAGLEERLRGLGDHAPVLPDELHARQNSRNGQQQRQGRQQGPDHVHTAVPRRLDHFLQNDRVAQSHSLTHYALPVGRIAGS